MQNIKSRLAAECKTANEMIGYQARLQTFRFVYLNAPVTIIMRILVNGNYLRLRPKKWQQQDST